jgi:hypothetical protein
MNCEVKVEWNSDKTSGTARKYLDNSYLTNLGFSKFTSLEKGLEFVIENLEKLAVDGFTELRWNQAKL